MNVLKKLLIITSVIMSVFLSQLLLADNHNAKKFVGNWSSGGENWNITYDGALHIYGTIKKDGINTKFGPVQGKISHGTLSFTQYFEPVPAGWTKSTKINATVNGNTLTFYYTPSGYPKKGPVNLYRK
jgi:hypothetical protein